MGASAVGLCADYARLCFYYARDDARDYARLPFIMRGLCAEGFVCFFTLSKYTRIMRACVLLCAGLCADYARDYARRAKGPSAHSPRMPFLAQSGGKEATDR